jgi:hypothetical protein
MVEWMVNACSSHKTELSPNPGIGRWEGHGPKTGPNAIEEEEGD